MIAALLLILILLWLLGYIRIGGIAIPEVILFTINNQPITLWHLLILIAVAWVVSILPTPFREIVGVLFIVWILATLGIIGIGGIALSNILVIAIIIGIIAALFRPRV